jgi:hypothetical protein
MNKEGEINKEDLDSWQWAWGKKIEKKKRKKKDIPKDKTQTFWEME